MGDRFLIKGIEFRSRLWIGTGKYKNFEETARAADASGADVITVAVRRVNIVDRRSENLLDYIDPKKYKILPNTAGCYTVPDALRYSRLAREAGVSDMVKLEVIGDEKTLFPDTAAKVPVIVDAGVGTASDATVAMELGCDAVLINTAIAEAKDPIAMAEAMKYAVIAGRLAYKSGRIPKKLYGAASSPIEGML
ncbi:thiazole synthase [Thermodesulfovibrionales bacterium]|nr:thiazole synthase [Thermodesulfovibrionales bacterium]